MTLTQILVSGFGILITVLGYFLVKFDKQVEKMSNNVEQIKINQAVDSEKLKQFENRIQTVETLMIQTLKPNEKN
jgi:hypothetical protein